MSEERVLTGKPSVDRPWMKYYPPIMLQMIKRPYSTIRKYLLDHCPGMNVEAIHYYQRHVMWSEVFEEAERAAKALKAMGVVEGMQIPVYFRLVPEFVTMLLAAERVGASLVCRDNTLEENVECAAKAGAKVIFAHTFLSEAEKEAYMAAGVEKFVLLSPTRKTSRKNMPSHVKECLDSYFHGQPATGDNVVSFDTFLGYGDSYYGPVAASEDINRPLLRAYTSGSTGPSKQVIHSADSMLSIICQMNFYGASDEFRPNWLVTCLPPALVAVVVSMLLLPLSSNKLMIMDPFVFEKDIDLEIMHYKANNWPAIPMFFEILMRNGRMEEDYDLSHLLAAGAGSESFNNTQLKHAQQFFKKHGCNWRFSISYGCSEGGSNLTLPMAPKPYGSGNVGIPMPLSIISIFKPGTQEELGYNEIGEICNCSPGNMLGYDDEEATKKALQLHDDGNVWLHIGDLGYMDEDGVLYTVTRGESPRFGGGDLAIQPLENTLADAQIKGIDDQFFVIAKDPEHPGYFLPYLYVVLEVGYTVDDVREQIMGCLEDYMRPVEIIEIDERPFFHYKTARRILAAEIEAKNAK